MEEDFKGRTSSAKVDNKKYSRVFGTDSREGMRIYFKLKYKFMKIGDGTQNKKVLINVLEVGGILG